MFLSADISSMFLLETKLFYQTSGNLSSIVSQTDLKDNIIILTAYILLDSDI